MRVLLDDDGGRFSDAVADVDMRRDLIEPGPEVGSGRFGVVADQLVDFGGRGARGQLSEEDELAEDGRAAEDEIVARIRVLLEEKSEQDQSTLYVTGKKNWRKFG